VLENAPQMALGLYYTFAVTQTGVTRVGLLSIGTSALSTVRAVIKAVTAVAHRTCKHDGVGQPEGGEGCELSDTAPGRFDFSTCFIHNIKRGQRFL
jgi:hypothetical protein